jgi:hypothetical protein
MRTHRMFLSTAENGNSGGWKVASPVRPGGVKPVQRPSGNFNVPFTAFNNQSVYYLSFVYLPERTLMTRGMLVLTLSLLLLGSLFAMADDRDRDDHVRHVLLISVDGLHALDVANFIGSHPAQLWRI